MANHRFSTLRHESVFSAARFIEILGPPTLVGAGALGSEIGCELAALGLGFSVYDPDNIEQYNIANQAYYLAQIGQPKVSALSDLAAEKSGAVVRTHWERYSRNERTSASKVVILAVDSMRARKEIFEGALERNLRVLFVIDTRMGITSGMSIAFNPNHPVHLRHYRSPSLYYDDKDTAPRTLDACGQFLSIKCTASLVVGWAITQLIQWFNYEYPDPDIESKFAVAPLDNEIRVQWNPPGIITRKFE